MPQAPNLGLTGAGGALAFQNELQKMIAERREAEQLQYERAIAERDWTAKQEEAKAMQAHRTALQQYQAGDLTVRQEEAAARRAAALQPKPRNITTQTGLLPMSGKGRETIFYDKDTGEIIRREPEAESAESPGGERERAYARFVERLGRPPTQAEESAFQQHYTSISTRPPQPPASEPLEAVVVNGTIKLLPRSQAAGMSPPTVLKPSTGEEKKNFAFFNRAQEADQIVAPLETDIAKMGFAGQVGLQYLPNVLQSQAGQSYRQAQRDFTEARLRQVSGAAINKSEYENDERIYFAQPGDSPATIEQKRAARKRVIDGLAFTSGKAYDEFFGEPFKLPGAEKLGGAGGGGGGKFTVTDPTGKVHSFETQAQADTFKRLIAQKK